MGGRSIECEVSLNSGRTVCDHLDPEKYKFIPIFQALTGQLFILPLRFLHRGKISDFENKLELEAEKLEWDDLKKLIDFLYIATHGRYAEDGTLQGILEVLGIPYLGSKVLASALSMNKPMQKEFLKRSGISVPSSLLIKPGQIKNLDLKKNLEIQNLAFPLIVKPAYEGSSLGVTKVKNIYELKAAINLACNIFPDFPQDVLVEELLSGMEFSCITITDNKTGKFLPLPPTEIVPEEHGCFDYTQKYMPGRATKFTPPRCSEIDIKNIQETCVAVTKTLSMTNMSRIDGFLQPDGKVVIIDPNSLSGMAPSSFLFREAAEVGLNHSQLINHLIETELMTLDREKQEPPSQSKKIKLRVAVLMGGSSSEREISLESGRNVTYKLSSEKYEPIPLFVSSKMELYKMDSRLLIRNSTKEIENLLDPSTKIGWSTLKQISDFVFIALHGGQGENGALQGTLDMLDLPYNGSSVLTSSLCIDKHKTNKFLASSGLDTPNSLLFSHAELETKPDLVSEKIIKKIGFPAIIKPSSEGCSTLVMCAKNETELKTCFKNFSKNHIPQILVEELVDGLELTVGVVGNKTPKAMPPSLSVAHNKILSLEEKFLPGEGENQTPAPISKAALKLVQSTVEQVYEKLGCRGYARIDCFYQDSKISPRKKERVVILEINTLPALTPATCIFHQAMEIGIAPRDFIDKIVELGLEAHKKVGLVEKTTKPIKNQKEI